MIDEVATVRDLYSSLTPAGKRLFQSETGLKGPRRGTGRRRAASKQRGTRRRRTRGDESATPATPPEIAE